MLRHDGFFPPDVIAFTTGNEINFSLAPDQTQPIFSNIQKKFLSDIIGDVPGYCSLRQVHGSRIITCKENKVTDAFEEGDALITAQKNFALAVRTADCLPVFLFDKKNDVLGIVHAGWKSTLQKIVIKTAAAMKSEWGSDPADLQCLLGPAIRSCCYSVGTEFLEYFPLAVTTREGKHYFDLSGENRRQLEEAGVSQAGIFDCGKCSCCGESFHSYRRDGAVAGRMLSVILIKEGRK